MDGCPMSSQQQAAPSSNPCPIPRKRSPGARSLLGRSLSKSPAISYLSGGDIHPVGLPDVTGDLNPPYDEFDEDAIYKDLRERVRYLTHFVSFTEQDVEALNEFQPILLPLVDQLVDNVYHQLFKFDVTKQVFMPRKGGEEGRMMSDLHDLALDAPQIEMRKKTFAVYMRKLVTSDYNDFATWQYFDQIGIMHTGQNELKHRRLMGKAPLYVDLMHLSLLLAWTLDVLTPVILSYAEYPLSRRIDIMRAFQKVVWIQNDLFTRHYAVRSTEVAGLKALRESVNLSSSDEVNTELRNIQTYQATVSTISSESGGSGSGEYSPRRQRKPSQDWPSPSPVKEESKVKKGWFGIGK
ncbi:Protoglobin-domain-containing protein [Coprinopsis sp. MPI-PUGE-AT-0042]|nr:Protoglobin-domain-containing protein [Coprinopsis sp. MPI-PUGE-AT-0042]